jgi:beta-lactamase class A
MTEFRRSIGPRQILGRTMLVSLLLLSACRFPSDQNPRAASPAALSKAARAGTANAILRPAPAPAAAPPTPAIPSAALALDTRLKRLGESFQGDIGLAVRDVQTGWTSNYRGLDYFPQQSVSKLWVAISLLDQVDRGTLALSSDIVVGRDDLTLFHQPIRALALQPGGFHTTTGDLMVRALTQSDNSANDRLLQRIGGPDIVRATLARKAIAGIRFGPGERALQSGIAGLAWKPAYAVGDSFYAARDALPAPARRLAFDAYVADPIDGATPLGMVDALARLKSGQLLSAESTERLTSIMSQTRTGPQRLKGGLQPGWTLSHKTGTGQVLLGEQAGYNDVGILTAPSGRSYTVAVLIGRTSRPLPERMALMQRVVAATIDYDAKLTTQQEAATAN